MKQKLLASICALLTSAGFSLAGPVEPPADKDQTPPLPNGVAQAASAQPERISAPASATQPAWIATPAPTHPVSANNHFWASGEYLLWWVKDAPIPVTILRTNPDNLGTGPQGPNGAFPGLIGTPLLGGHPQGFRPFSGARFTAGSWIGSDRRFGVEGSGFYLLRRTARSSFATDSAGNPASAISFFNAFQFDPRVPVGEAGASFSNPASGIDSNNNIANLISGLRMWGAEANGLLNLYRQGSWEVNLLAGFRHVALREDLTDSSTGANVRGPQFGNGFTIDRFATRNAFDGGQLGGRVSYRSDRASLDFYSKVALGSVEQSVDVSGQFFFFAAAGVLGPFEVIQNFPIGSFALPSNIGHHSRRAFAVIPEVELKAGYDVLSFLRVTVGYDFLYVSNVMRSGDQIDRRINFTQNPAVQGQGTLIGPALPTTLFNTTDFFAHGLSVVLEFSF
jgi:hypothetical protein